MAQVQTTPPSGWDTENKHLVGMPRFVLEDVRAERSGYLRPLCKRCAAIPWAELAINPRYGADGDLRIFIKALEELRDSPCRICRLLWTIRPFGWLKYLGCVPAVPGSDFKARLCFFPGNNTNVPKGANPDLYGYLGITDRLDLHLPFPSPAPEYIRLDLVKGWMAECGASHGNQCAPDDAGELEGLHVIDSETATVIIAPKACDYVALSYVWGPPSEFVADFVFPGLPNAIPPTIADAISVTKALGLRYIWIDRYCINQADPEHKMQQIRQMGEIYSSARLTIVAAAGASPKYGLPGISRARQVLMPEGQVVGSIALVCTAVSAAVDVYRSTWAYRAWTFQEAYLSRRRLFFTDHTVLYVCAQGQKADIFKQNFTLGNVYNNRTLELFLPWTFAMSFPKDWNVQSENLAVAARHVKAFSERLLTYDSDALNATLGILDRLSKMDQDPVYHLWGVPFAPYNREYQNSSSVMQSYDIALNWFHDTPCRRRTGFPTWSSIAWDGKAEHADQDQLMVPDHLDLRVMCSGVSMSLEEYVKSGSVLQDSGSPDAPVKLELRQVTTIPLRLTTMEDGIIGVVLQFSIDIDLVIRVFVDEAGLELDSIFTGAIIYRDHQSRRIMIMILSPRNGIYERVGFIVLDEDRIAPDGRVCDRKSGQPIRDAQYLNANLERPVRFVSEAKEDVILG